MIALPNSYHNWKFPFLKQLYSTARGFFRIKTIRYLVSIVNICVSTNQVRHHIHLLAKASPMERCSARLNNSSCSCYSSQNCLLHILNNLLCVNTTCDRPTISGKLTFAPRSIKSFTRVKWPAPAA